MARTRFGGRRHHVKGHYRYSYQHREALRAEEGRNVHLYTNPTERRENLAQFERRYGKNRGQYVYGAIVGKVRREQIGEGRRGPIEHVRAHGSHSRKGKAFRVRGHRAYI